MSAAQLMDDARRAARWYRAQPVPLPADGSFSLFSLRSGHVYTAPTSGRPKRSGTLYTRLTQETTASEDALVLALLASALDSAVERFMEARRDAHVERTLQAY